MNPHYAVVAARAEHRCEYCHAPEAIFNVPFEVDHILPVSRGGKDTLENLALACRACNLRKSNVTAGVDPLTDEEVELIHPRLHVWDMHFEVEGLTAATLYGNTPTGRTTIVQLQMNAPLQQVARQQWVKLGLFP